MAEYNNDDELTAEYIYAGGKLLGEMDPFAGYKFVYQDHLGSTRMLSNADLQRDYYPYGEAKNASGNDDMLYQFSGKELDSGTGLYYFGARYYNPEIGRWLVPDPAGQGFSPYVYCGNNPVIFIDPNGEWFGIDDAIAGLIGGTINLAVNLLQGNVHGWDAFGYFGAGFASGTLSLYGPAGWAAGGAILGASNAALGGAQGWDIAEYAGIGAVSGFAGGGAGQWAAKNLGGVVINGFHVSSPVAKGIIGGTIGGAAGGYAGGFSGGLLMSGNISVANQAGLSGMYSGMSVGGITGGVSGYKYAIDNDLNPWSGRPKQSIVIGRSQARVDLVAENVRSETVKFPDGLNAYNEDGSANPVGLTFNQEWIAGKVQSQYYIYNNGNPLNLGPSPYYNLELNAITDYNRVYNILFHYKNFTLYK